MKKSDVQELVDMNYRICILLGMVTPLLIDSKNRCPKSEHYKFDWFLEALNNVIYLKKSIPPLPEKEFV